MADISFFIVFIKFGKAVGKKPEGGADKDSLSSSFFDLTGDV